MVNVALIQPFAMACSRRMAAALADVEAAVFNYGKEIPVGEDLGTATPAAAVVIAIDRLEHAIMVLRAYRAAQPQSGTALILVDEDVDEPRAAALSALNAQAYVLSAEGTQQLLSALRALIAAAIKEP